MSDSGTPLLAPPYAEVRLWCCPLPHAGRARRKQALHQWLDDFLRQQLGGQIELTFASGQAPQLIHNHQPLGLSLSYAGQLGLVALASQPVGVDLVWQADLGDDAALLAQDYLPVALAKHLAALPEPQRSAAAAQAWARLEAALKASGRTLAEVAGLQAAAWQRSVPLLGLPHGYCGALALSVR